jgi:serine/threonine protein kinase
MRPDAPENTVNRPTEEAASVNGAAEETESPASATRPDGDKPPFGPSSEPGEIGRLGKYRIQRELGRGGMGAVYLAFDERLQRKVALKVMLPKAAANATARDRFLREARAAARISSDYVVNIYEADEIDGLPFIALQYLQGYPLDEYLKKKGNPTLPQVIRLGR